MMKTGIEEGVGRVKLTVTEEMSARLEDLVAHPVYSTFWLVYHAEVASRLAIEPFFEPGENAVGTFVQIKHHNMAAIGAEVEVVARVTRVEGRRIECTVTATAINTKTLLAEGLQEQFLLSSERLAQKVSEAVL